MNVQRHPDRPARPARPVSWLAPEPASPAPYVEPRGSATGPVRMALVILCLVATAGYGASLVEILAAVLDKPEPYLPFVYGLLGYVLLRGVLLRRWRSLFRAWEHETTHALAARLMRKRVASIEVSAQHGRVAYTARDREKAPKPHAHLIISLAPYLFPTVTVLPLLGLLVAAPDAIFSLKVVVGASTAYHLLATLREARPYQPDLFLHGVGFSLLIIATVNVITLGVILTVVGPGSNHVGTFLASGLHNVWGWLVAPFWGG